MYETGDKMIEANVKSTPEFRTKKESGGHHKVDDNH